MWLQSATSSKAKKPKKEKENDLLSSLKPKETVTLPSVNPPVVRPSKEHVDRLYKEAYEIQKQGTKYLKPVAEPKMSNEELFNSLLADNQPKSSNPLKTASAFGHAMTRGLVDSIPFAKTAENLGDKTGDLIRKGLGMNPASKTKEEMSEEIMSPLSSGARKTADILGSLVGTGATWYGGYQTVGKAAAQRLAPQLGRIANPTGNKLATEATKNLAVASTIGTAQSLEEGHSPEQWAKNVGTNFLIDTALDATMMGAGKIYRTLKKSGALDKPKELLSLPPARQTGNALPNTQRLELPAPKTDPPLIFKTQVPKTDFEKPIKLELVKPKVSTVNKPSPLAGPAKIRNTRMDKAITEYNQAVEVIQNHFKTNELRLDEMNRVKTELGIDLDRLVKNIEQAQTPIDLLTKAERARLGRVAGVFDVPKTLAKPFPEPVKPKVELPQLPPAQGFELQGEPVRFKRTIEVKPELPPVNTVEKQVNTVKTMKQEAARLKAEGNIPMAQKLETRAKSLEKQIELPKPTKEAMNQAAATKPFAEKAVSFFDEAESKARERINKRKGRLLSNLPVDDLADYAIIGASKMAKGSLQFAQWANDMVKEFGDEIKPHLRSIHQASVNLIKAKSKNVEIPPEVEMELAESIKSIEAEQNLKKIHRQIKSNQSTISKAQEKIAAFQKQLNNPNAPAKELEYQIWQEQDKIKKAQERLAKWQGQLKGNEQPAGKAFEVVDDIDVSNLKDPGEFESYNTDVYRLFKKVFGADFGKVKNKILDPFDASKKANIDMQKEWTDRIQNEIVKKYGITKGSKKSELVQLYGEGGYKWFNPKTQRIEQKKYTLEDLKREAPKDWQDIVSATEWFRKAYNELIDQVNSVRATIYPTDPTQLVGYREDYFRHFREMSEGFGGLMRIFDTPAAIGPKLAGKTSWTKPKTKFLGFKQERGLGQYEIDALGGFLEYLPSAARAIHIDPHIPKFRNLADELADATEESRHLNVFIEFLQDYANDLAGKTNALDASAQKILGRKFFRGLAWLNNRVKANVILGNVGSALAQFANVTNGIGYAKQHSVKGLAQTVGDIFNKKAPSHNSGFLKERFGVNMYSKFDTKLIDQPKKLAVWMIETADKLGTSFVWNSVYRKGISEGIQNPIKYADDVTRALVAGRGIGEIPLIQRSQIIQLIMPFTLEVANLWKVQKDFVNAKDFGGLVTLYLAAFTFNKGMEEVRGSGVVFDPVQALFDAVPEMRDLLPAEVDKTVFGERKREDLSLAQRGGRLAGEVLSNIPLGQFVATMYPEYGTKVMGQELPSRKELFGRNDPTRFGTGLLATKGIQDPLGKVLLPFGGLQLQKTLAGADALLDKGVYKDTGQLKSLAKGTPLEPLLGPSNTELNYPIDRKGNIAQGLMFGKGGLEEARSYYDQNRRPLSEKQTTAHKTLVDQGYESKNVYEALMKDRKVRTVKTKVNGIVKDEKLTPEQKRDAILKLLEQEGKQFEGGSEALLRAIQ